VKISERFYNAIEKFFFPKKSADDNADHTDIAHVNLMGPGSGDCITLQMLFILFVHMCSNAN